MQLLKNMEWKNIFLWTYFLVKLLIIKNFLFKKLLLIFQSTNYELLNTQKFERSENFWEREDSNLRSR